MKKIRDIFSGNEGFTLIELLIVIVIIGVLAAIAVPNIAGLGDSANEEAVRANMRTLLIEIESAKATDDNFKFSDTYISELSAYKALEDMDDVTDMTVTQDGTDDTKGTVKATVTNLDNFVITEGRITTTSS